MDSSIRRNYKFGAFLLNAKERLLLRDGQPITLTPKAFDTLLLLVANAGHVLTKEEMLTQLWPDTFVEEANLTNNISLLRRVLGDDSEGQQFIKTVPRHGYRFVAAVKPVQSVADKESRAFPFTRSRPIIVSATIVITLLLVVIGVWISRTSLSRPAIATLPFRERDWILITSFENRTGEPLFEGTIESALERELSNSRFANVITHERIGDSLRLMKKPLDTKIDAAVGREICLRDGAIRALVTGRVDKFGTTYVMSVSLVDPFGDRTVAGTSEEATNQESLWPAIRRLSNWIRETLGEALPSIQQSSQALEKVTTPSLRALQLYSKAMALVNQWQASAAEQVLRQAITEDPAFASAHIMLAHMVRNQRKPAAEWRLPSQHALNLSERTSELERYFIEGSYYGMRGNYQKAVSAYEALVRNYPDNFWGRNNLGWNYFYVGRWQESVTEWAEAAELRPNDLRINRLAAWNLLQIDVERARRVAQRAAQAITPDMNGRHPYEVAWVQLFAVHDLWVRGELESAVSEIDRAAQTFVSQEGPEREAFIRNIGNWYLTFGQLSKAEEFFAKLPDTDEERNIYLAEVAHDTGDKRKFKNYLSRLKGLPKALLLARGGFTGESLKLLSEWKRSAGAIIESDRIFMRVVEGEIALSLGRRTEAISLLEEAVPATRWNSSATFFTESVSLAEALERQGDLQKAVEVFERASRQKGIAYENSGSTGRYWLKLQSRLAQLYRKLGRDPEAEKVEAELSKILAYADKEHPILLQMNSQRVQSSFKPVQL